MSKNIWIINEYAGSPYHGMEFRHYYLAREFVKLGHNVTIIAASFSHLFRNPPDIKETFTLEEIDGINYLWIKVPRYKGSTDKRRVLKWLKFSSSLFYLPYKKLSKPDVIILSPMATFPVLPAYRLAKKFKAKFIYEVKDIWPLTLIELGGYSPKHPFIALMRWFELFALRRADHIVSVLPNYGDYLKDNGVNRDFIYIPNGVDLEELNQKEELDKNIKKLIPKDKFIVGYTGTIGIANALDVLVKAAYILRDYRDIAFIIVGDGQEKENLMRMVKEMNLNNVIFISSIPKRQVHSILELFDVCYIGLKKQKLFKYGVSPNKIFDYMYSGKPIIHTISTKNDIVTMAQCGISVEAEDPEAVADAIVKLKSMDYNEREEMGRKSKEYVIANHNYKILAEKFLEVIK
jgi:glycosyltransferase involved in cell wall biosynthesis